MADKQMISQTAQQKVSHTQKIKMQLRIKTYIFFEKKVTIFKVKNDSLMN